MKKVATNVLVVSAQLIISGLFLFMLFSDNTGDNKVVIAHNDNLNKMADSVSLLFSENQSLIQVVDEIEVELLSVEEVEAQKEKEALEKAKAEEEARIKAEEEARAIEEPARSYITFEGRWEAPFSR